MRLFGEANPSKRPEVRAKISAAKYKGNWFACMNCLTVHKCSAYQLKTKKYCSRKCRGEFMSRSSGPEAPNWKGGRLIDGDGYVIIYSGKKQKHVPEHRLLMERWIGRKLRSNEVVHHKDRNTKNNELSNLQLLTNSEHMQLHWVEDRKPISSLGRFVKVKESGV